MEHTIAQPIARRPAPKQHWIRHFGVGAVLALGVVVVPVAIIVLSNSWDAPDAAAYVRMAFATVAASTIAIITAVGVLVHRVITRSRVRDIYPVAVITAIVVGMGASNLLGATDLLLQRLGLLG